MSWARRARGLGAFRRRYRGRAAAETVGPIDGIAGPSRGRYHPPMPLHRPPFRAEHVGSFLRPDRLLAAVRAHRAGSLDDAALRAVQDDCVAEIVAFQDRIGLPSITDGEFRRRSWSAGVIDALDGVGLRREGMLNFKSETGGDAGVAPSPYAEAPLARRRPMAADEFRFLNGLSPRGLPKATMASPSVLHFFLGPRSFAHGAYPDRDAFFADLVRIYREEVMELAAAGCRYLQLDDTALPCNCDAGARAAVAARGEDADALTEAYAAMIDDILTVRPAEMTAAVHMCRGNLKGMWMAEGGYEPIAERVLGGLDADLFLMEYDTERAGDFLPLRHLPAGKTAVLGLISTKTPRLEKRDDVIRRIEEAARIVPIDRLALGPQCGFASAGGGGQALGPDDTARKLELVLDVAREVWGAV